MSNRFLNIKNIIEKFLVLFLIFILILYINGACFYKKAPFYCYYFEGFLRYFPGETPVMPLNIFEK